MALATSETRPAESPLATFPIASNIVGLLSCDGRKRLFLEGPEPAFSELELAMDIKRFNMAAKESGCFKIYIKCLVTYVYQVPLMQNCGRQKNEKNVEFCKILFVTKH